MGYIFRNDHVYDSGITGAELINILNDKYGLLDNWEYFVDRAVTEGQYEDFDDTSEFLTFLWQDYLLTRAHGISFGPDSSSNFPFIKSGNLVMNTIVELEDEY